MRVGGVFFLPEVRLGDDVLALADRPFMVHCYRSLLLREPEFEGAETLSSIEAKAELIVRILGSDELHLSPGLHYRNVLLRFSKALGREDAVGEIMRQVEACLPTLEEFRGALPAIAENMVSRTLEANSAKAFSIGHAHDEVGGAELSGLKQEIAILTARVTMLERKVF